MIFGTVPGKIKIPKVNKWQQVNNKYKNSNKMIIINLQSNISINWFIHFFLFSLFFILIRFDNEQWWWHNVVIVIVFTGWCYHTSILCFYFMPLLFWLFSVIPLVLCVCVNYSGTVAAEPQLSPCCCVFCNFFAMLIPLPTWPYLLLNNN